VRLVRLTLTSVDVRIESAGTAREAISRFNELQPELVLLDVRLSDASGLEVLREIRRRSTCPVVALTAAGDQTLLTELMTSGADDIVRKPFSPDRLAAVVEHFLGRPRQKDPDEAVIRARGVEISLSDERVTLHGQVVQLTRSEWLLLRALAAHQRMPQLYQELLTEVWGPQYRENLEYLRLIIARLRSKLADEGNLIRDYLDVGYSLNA